MSRVGINVYALSVFGDKAQQVELHNVVDGKDIVSLIKEYIEENIQQYTDNDDKESISMYVDYEVVEQRDEDNAPYLKYLYGRMKSGNYGVETEIVDKETGKVTHVQKPTEASVLPFDFLVILPEGEALQTVFITQTQGIFGVKTLLEYGIGAYVHRKDMTLKVHFGTLYPRAYLEKFLNEGALKKIKLFRYNMPREEADRFGAIPGVRSKRAQQIITVTSPLGFSKQKIQEIRDCIYGRRTYNSIVEIDDFVYDDLKLEFKLGSMNKTISLRNLDKVVVSEDITDEVELKNGNPTKESIIPVMVETGTSYLIEMGYLEPIDGLIDEVVENMK